MSKLAKLFLAAAPAQVSNEDRVPDDVAPPIPARPVDAAPVGAVPEAVPAPEVVIDASADVEETSDYGFDPADDAIVAANPDEDESAQALVAAQTDAREERESVESLKTSLEGLNQFHRFLSHLNATGGVSRQALAFTQIGLEAYTEGLEQPAIGLGVSLESFLVNSERQELSLEHLEHFIDQLKGIVPIAEQNVISAEQHVLETSRAFHPTLRASFESMMAGAESNCGGDGAAMAAAQDLDSQAQVAQVGDAAAAALDGMERVRDEVVAQNADGGLSQEALVAASLALEAFTKPLGLPEIELAADLTPFADGARAQVSVEAINLGMEGAMDALKNAGAAIAAKARKTVATVKNALNMLNGMLPKTIEALEAFIADLDKNKVQTKGTVSAKGLAKKLHDGGKIPANIPQYLIGFAGFAERFMGSYCPAAQVAFGNNSRAIAKLDFNSQPGFRASLGTLAGEWKDPRSTLGAADLAATIPGEGRVFVDQEAPKYDGDVKELQHFIDLQTKNVLHGTWFRPERKLSDASVNLPAMAYADIKKVATALLKLLKGIDTKDLEVDSQVIHDYWEADEMLTGFQMQSRGMRGRFRKEIKIIGDAFFQSTVMPALEFGWDMARSSVRVTRTFMAYAKASLATAAGDTSVSKEGLDESGETASTEALKGGLIGYGASMAGTVAIGALLGVVGVPAAAVVSVVKGAHIAIALGLKSERRALEKEIHDISNKIAALQNKETVKDDTKDGKLSGDDILYAFFFSSSVYAGYLGSEVEDLKKQLELKAQEYKELTEKALNEVKVAKESLDSLASELGVSLEGADPKELKSGTKVKFSHGHGKVDKVYTAPFMFDKKTHTASKDQPKYLVKDAKGKHSIHKASALTVT